jgi:hypothetical protein
MVFSILLKGKKKKITFSLWKRSWKRSVSTPQKLSNFLLRIWSGREWKSPALFARTSCLSASSSHSLIQPKGSVNPVDFRDFWLWPHLQVHFIPQLKIHARTHVFHETHRCFNIFYSILCSFILWVFLFCFVLFCFLAGEY